MKRHAFFLRRDHVGKNQISTLGKRGILQGFEQTWMNLNPLFLIHFRFSKTCPTVIFYGYLQCFFNVLISDVLKRSRGFRSGGMYMYIYICKQIDKQIHIYICIFASTCYYTHIPIYTHTYTYIHILICIYIYMYIYLYVYMYVCIYI